MISKKFLLSVTMITLTITGSLLNHGSVQAAQIKSKTNKTSNFSLIEPKKENSSVNEIFGSFYTTFTKPYDPKLISLGTVEDNIPQGLTLSVINGGPESLTWTAQVLDETKHQKLTEAVKFVHGYNGLTLVFDKGKPDIGDSLAVWLVNDNFPKGVGALHIEGKIGPFFLKSTER